MSRLRYRDEVLFLFSQFAAGELTGTAGAASFLQIGLPPSVFQATSVNGSVIVEGTTHDRIERYALARHGPADRAHHPRIGVSPLATSGKRFKLTGVNGVSGNPTKESLMASRLNPYLSFTDNARQAMEFYKEVFGGTWPPPVLFRLRSSAG